MPFMLIVTLMFIAFIAFIILLGLFGEIALEGIRCFFTWLCVEAMFLTLIAGGVVWLSNVDANEELGWETFHSLVIDVQDGEDVQCVELRNKSSINFVNINAKFSHIIKEDTLVRRYANKNWSCGVYSFCPTIHFELITPKHKRYAEIKEKIEKDTTTKPVN